ncbi:hypothetical protein CC1G_09423 [Coprinopsis cinerea okayama7|uniref:RING-CH-type domain-containing protein n=1 Tax=Coprinopsis cinerea (strain Okayama-7 / 130 / ATCC MYA-4618 / FGSC 9003) TaxID=240176 RepID=A8NIJ4_COPC7|nr:hypothetical protein CC1G_09423 [Coprinopsis cinerea okayama7\|eukprot:XP_001834009.1 hypothetical protein CC1G_09423 [Coprinopsis cinerea okayama7\
MSTAQSTALVPTVNDLKVKLCYICREEENYNDPPENPPRAWAHPCKCTLVAHEQCLLKWIQSSQKSEVRASKALKCPQCESTYELESDKPLIFRVMEKGHRILRRAGAFVVLFGFATVAGVIGTSVYVVCTAYGAWAVQKFVGQEMYQICLGDDPSKWPWSAFLNLPLLPWSLILMQFPALNHISPGLPLLLAWPTTFSNQRIAEYWSLPENAQRLLVRHFVPTRRPLWPPSPILFGLVGIPIIRSLYEGLHDMVYTWLMGTRPPVYRGAFGGRNGARVNIGNNGQFVIRVREEFAPAAAPQPANGAENANGNDNANANGQQANNGDGDNEPENLLDISISTIGRRVGGALLVPVISNWMGQLLLRIAKSSPLLRTFLAIREPIGKVWLPPPQDSIGNWNSMGTLRQLGMVAQVAWKGLLVNTGTTRSDPVWWRNTVGLGLFVVARDCVKLIHLYYAKRELESRRVKNRDFSGVDISTLDLTPDFYARASAAAQRLT